MLEVRDRVRRPAGAHQQARPVELGSRGSGAFAADPHDFLKQRRVWP